MQQNGPLDPHPKLVREEHAIVLDFLPHGYPFDPTPSHRKNPIIQAIGRDRFVLLELVAKKEAFVQPLQEVYIGEGKRDQVNHVAGRIALEKLTSTAKTELEFVIKDIIKKREADFVQFFNTAHPLSLRVHQLEMLPGLGKKHLWEILDARQDRPFVSFADLRERVKLMPDPEKMLLRRILNEIAGKEKHPLFTDV